MRPRPGAIQLLLVVADGRVFTDATGEGPADFSALSSEIARAGVRLFLLSFPAPDADVEQSARNLADLASSVSFHPPGRRRSARVGGNVSDPRYAPRFPRTPHELAHAHALATRDLRAGPEYSARRN